MILGPEYEKISGIWKKFFPGRCGCIVGIFYCKLLNYSNFSDPRRKLMRNIIIGTFLQYLFKDLPIHITKLCSSQDRNLELMFFHTKKKLFYLHFKVNYTIGSI